MDIVEWPESSEIAAALEEHLIHEKAFTRLMPYHWELIAEAIKEAGYEITRKVGEVK